MTETNKYRTSIKVLGFDLDQTLYPKSPEIDEAIQGYIYQKIAAYKKCTRADASRMFRELYKDGSGMSGSEALARIGVPNGADVVQEALENADIEKFLQPNSEVQSLLVELRDAYAAVDLVTGSSLHVAEQKLAKLGISLSNFRNIIAGDKASKSSGEAYKFWLSLYPEYRPTQFLYIGDRARSDYEVPKTFGIRSVLVNVAEPKKNIECPQLPTLVSVRSLLL